MVWEQHAVFCVCFYINLVQINKYNQSQLINHGSNCSICFSCTILRCSWFSSTMQQYVYQCYLYMYVMVKYMYVWTLPVDDLIVINPCTISQLSTNFLNLLLLSQPVNHIYIRQKSSVKPRKYLIWIGYVSTKYIYLQICVIY